MREFGRGLITVLLVAGVLGACKVGPEPAGSHGATRSGGEAQAGGSAGVGQGQAAPAGPTPQERVASRCPANQSVTSGDLAEVGGALYRAYQAALKGNTSEAFEEFQAAFHADADRNHLKTQIFPRVVEHVGKYVAGPSDPSFTLCRIEKQTPERVKVFVQSRDPRKSDPPSILVLRDGKWLLDAMTP